MEILVVVAIIVVLAGVGVAYLLPQVDVAKEGVVKSNLRLLTDNCKMYWLQNGNNWPPSLDALAQVQPNGGPPLIPPDQLLDPWQHPYNYDPSGANNGGMQPDISTSTPQGKLIGNWPGAH
jgi:type II secretory pathway pseudopilin PulG